MTMRQLEDFNPNLYHSTEDYQCIITSNEQTFVDKTVWTIYSNFIASTVLLTFAIKLCYFPHQRKACHGWSSRQQVVERLAPLFLLMEAMSHGVLGLYHLTVTNALSQNLWQSVAQMFGIFASVVFFLFSIMVVLSSQQKISRLVQVFWRAGISGLWLAIIYAYMFGGSNIFQGISLHMYILVGISMLLLLAHGIRISHSTSDAKNAHFFVKSLAILVLIVATAYSYNVYKKCGSYNGYLECFIRCPLPWGLNHNSFYNLAKVLALVIWAMAEDFHPSVSLYQLTLGLREDEATVMSDGVDDDDDDPFDSELMEHQEDEDENDTVEETRGASQNHQNGVEESNNDDDLLEADDIESQPIITKNGSADVPLSEELSPVEQVDKSESSLPSSSSKETGGDDGRNEEETR